MYFFNKKKKILNLKQKLFTLRSEYAEMAAMDCAAGFDYWGDARVRLRAKIAKLEFVLKRMGGKDDDKVEE